MGPINQKTTTQYCVYIYTMTTYTQEWVDTLCRECSDPQRYQETGETPKAPLPITGIVTTK